MSNQKPLPPTKDGFRYSLCEDDEPLCSKYIRALNSVEANKRVSHPYFKRKIVPTIVKLSESDRAPQLKLDVENNRVTGEKGYSMVRATHGINRGKYYFEVYIDRMPENTATRIGWGQCYANLQAPLGYDCFGYSWRSRFGTIFHEARGKTYDVGGGYGQGDTLGCMIDLPFDDDLRSRLPEHLPKSIKTTGSMLAPKKRDQSVKTMEEIDEKPALTDMKPLVGSKISFYKNGKFVGVAFKDIHDGVYYPTISLYKSCTVTVNFGPAFSFPPEKFNNDSKNHLMYRPAQDMAEVSIIDNLMSDLIFILDQEYHVSDSSGFVENNLEEIVKKSVQGL